MTATLLPAALAGTTFSERFVSALELLFLGLAMVFTALILLFLLLTVLDRIAKRGDAKAAQSTAATAAAKPPAVPAAASAIPPEILAVITATVVAVVRQPFRIHSIRPAPLPKMEHSPWAEHGRAAIHTSHRIRKG